MKNCRAPNRYGSRFQVDGGRVDDWEKTARSLGAARNAVPSIDLAFEIFRGWHEGVAVHVRWDQDDSSHLVVCAEPHIRLESKAAMWVVTPVWATAAASTYFFISSSLILVFAGIVVGFAVGAGLYYALAHPFLWLIQRRYRARNDALAADIFAHVARWIHESSTMPVAYPGPPAVSAQRRST